MKKSKILITLLLCMLLIALAAVLVSCGESGDCQHMWNKGGFASEEDIPMCGVRTEGIKTYTCRLCGATRQEEVTNTATRCSLGDPVVTKEASCMTDGTQVRTCKNCGYQREMVITAIGSHNYDLVNAKIEGTNKIITCTRCNGKVTKPTVVRYGEFGARSNDGVCDHEAIRATHAYANEWGLKVEADPGAIYQIDIISQPAYIMTDVDWKDATFLINDNKIVWNDGRRGVDIFVAVSSKSSENVTPPANYTLAKDAKNIGFAPGEACMLYIENADVSIYNRYGINSGSSTLHEMILVDANGNVDPSTPVQYDYAKVTSIVKYATDDAPITISGGQMVTVSGNPKDLDPDYINNYCYFNRGIRVSRSNVTLDGVDHTKTGEHFIDDSNVYNDFGVPYRGFFYTQYAYNVTIKNATIWGHRAYSFKDGTARNEMGSYELGGVNCININYINLTQVGDITDRAHLHGVMGTNFCRNFYVEGCYLDRFDSHQGLHNATLKNTTFGFGILVIGGGTLEIDGCTRLSGGSFVLLRLDYNGIFDGDLIIRNCVAEAPITHLVEGVWRDFYNGLPNVAFNSITIDGLEVKNSSFALYNIPGASASALTNQSNPLIVPTKITATNVTGVANIKISADSGQAAAFKNTVVEGQIKK